MFREQLQKPDVDRIEGLSPAIPLSSARRVPIRVQFATTTEIHDYLRLLYASIGSNTATNAANPSPAKARKKLLSKF